MNSLLRTVTLRGGRENVFKESLSNQLSESVKDIQLEHYRTPDELELSSGKEATTSLCTVLEAIFIHGLKDTFLNRVSQVIGGDPDQHPQPSFWGPSLIFSHRETIDQVCNRCSCNYKCNLVLNIIRNVVNINVLRI